MKKLYKIRTLTESELIVAADSPEAALQGDAVVGECTNPSVSHKIIAVEEYQGPCWLRDSEYME